MSYTERDIIEVLERMENLMREMNDRLRRIEDRLSPPEDEVVQPIAADYADSAE